MHYDEVRGVVLGTPHMHLTQATVKLYGAENVVDTETPTILEN